MSTVEHQDATVLTDEGPRTPDAHWRTANHPAAGPICLLANPPLTEPLNPEHIKPRLLGLSGSRSPVPVG
ncbi:hypothetical protein OHU34_04850 [Streptomyces sp. NBC_00080]|uniref:hypothetical protein n=1 Tax=Streptomyces sp. NBC_00080 TaxID=2975645 RepID=UPI001E298711|nr:hypothetical protein [Streptomyces coriariae]